MDDPDAGIAGGVAVADVGAAIGRAVIDQQHLNRYIDLLVKDALNALLQIRLGIVDRHDHTDRNMFHHLFPLPLVQAAPGRCGAIGQRGAGTERRRPQLFAQRQVAAGQNIW